MKRARPPPALTTTDKDRKIDTPPTDGSKRQFGEKDNATAVDESLSWSTFNVDMIPTKKSLHSSFQRHLSAAQLHLNHQSKEETTKNIQLLDLGCGDGRLSKELSNNGFHVVGVDVNAEAVVMANERLHQCDGGGGRAVVGDVTTIRLPETFSCCLCQLLISVVGDVDQRRQLLNTVSHHLMPGGSLLLSASGDSGEINKNYARLYEKDSINTGEERTYYSRDKKGRVLYTTHHFKESELRCLIAEQENLFVEEFHVERETSSRRPDEAAYFFYVVARKRRTEEEDGRRRSTL